MKASKRHELQHDKFAQSLLRLGAGIVKYHKPIITSALAVALALVALLWFLSARESAEVAARTQLAAARTQVRHALSETGEKQEQAVADALAMLEAVAADHAASPAAPLAMLEAAHLLIAREKPKQAVPYFEKVLAASADTPGLVEVARRGLAQALEAGGDPAAALEHYRVLRETGAKSQRVQAAWDTGRCCETLNKPADARMAYQECKDLGGNTPWAVLADSRLQALGTGN